MKSLSVALCLLCVIFKSINAHAASSYCMKDLCDSLEHSNQARYDYYRMYYVDVKNNQQVKLLQDLEAAGDSYTFYGHARKPGQKLTIMVAAHKIAEFTDLIETYNIKHTILTYNFQEKIDEQNRNVQPKTIDPKKFDWNHYFHLETIYGWMESLAAEHHFIKMIDMGTSTEGIPIKGVSFIKNPSNPTVFIESGIHAREWIAPATATFLLNELIKSTDPRIQKYSRDLNWMIFPVVNPDGYKYTFEFDRMWRKNRQSFGICRGVDLNRNYPFHWNETGSSPNPCAYDYAGPSGSSETETKRLIEFVKNHSTEEDKIKTYIALHSFSQLIMFPYGFTPDRVNNYNDLKAIGQKAADTIKRISGKIYKTGSLYETIYPSSGGSKDWAHSVANIPITYTFELRGAADSEDLFLLPVDEIYETGQETVGAIMTIVEEADKLGYYKN